MRMTNQWMGTALSLFALTAACGDSPSGPGGAEALSNAEASVVAESQADLIDGILDGELASRPSIMSSASADAQLALSAVPVVTQFNFTRTRPCREGGQVVATGTGTHVADRMTGEVTLDFSGDKSIENCARVRGDVVVTINGDGTFEGHRMKVNGQFTGLQTNSQSGSFTWETSDGRSGSCEYQISVVWDPATHTKTITGQVCGHEIDRTVTRDGEPGNDRRDNDGA